MNGKPGLFDSRHKVIQARKSWIFNSQMIALHQNELEFRQEFNGAIKNILTASHDVLWL